MGAARVTEVLARTGGFSPQIAKHRLYETTQHILQVTSSLASIQPLGSGFASSIRVRLLHASVRRRILTLAAQKPSYYSVEKYGVPINDLDCVGTIATFSSTLIWLGFPRQGIYLREREIEDYIALWRLVAHYMGTPTSFFSSPAKARGIWESLMLEEIKPSPTSRILANNIIVSLQNQPPAYASRDFLVASARWLNGDDLADELGLVKVGLYYKALVAGQCLFFMALCYSHRSVLSWDRRKIAVSPIPSLSSPRSPTEFGLLLLLFLFKGKADNIQALRKMFYQLIVHNKDHGLGEETVFDFKYIPSLDITATEMGEYVPGTQRSSVEKRNFRTLVIAGAVMGCLSYVGFQVSWSLVNVVGSWAGL